MVGLDGIINPIPKNEKLKEAISDLLGKVLAMYYLRITGDGESLEESFEKLKREVKNYEMRIITDDKIYDVNLEKYVEKNRLGYILRQATNLRRPYNIMQQQSKGYDFMRFVLYEKSDLGRLYEEINEYYGLKDKDKIISISVTIREQKLFNCNN